MSREGEGKYSTELWAEEAVNNIEDRANSSQPWFLQVGGGSFCFLWSVFQVAFSAPRAPYQVWRYLCLYKPYMYFLGPRKVGVILWQRRPFWQKPIWCSGIKKSSTIFPHWSGRAKSHFFRLCKKPFFQVVRKAMVSAVDEAVGNIIEALETTGVKWGWGSVVLILTLILLTVKRFYTSMVLIRKCNWNDNSLCGGCWQIFHSKTSPCCKMWKYEKTTNNWVFCIFTQNSQLLQICSENCPKSYLIQNINRSNGKHGGYFHFRQWRGGEVLILHFYLSSKFFSTYKFHQMSVPLQIHTNPHYKTFSEANLPFQGLRGSINEVRHFSNQTNLLKTY